MGRVGSLGRVLDPSALDACAGPRARLRVEVPAAWLVEGSELLVTAPARLSCARCDGGGCDGCGRSGVLRAPDGVEDRVLHATVAPSPSAAAIALRITNPFGAGSDIAQLILEIHTANAPSAGVTRLARAASSRPSRASAPSPAPMAGGIPWPMIAAAAVAALVLALFGR